LQRLDWPLLAGSVALLMVGLLCLSSLDQVGTFWSPGPLCQKQLEALIPGLLLFLLAALVDYRWLRNVHWPLYALGLLGVLAVFIRGLSAKGAQRWLQLGSLGSLQPSEPLKLCVVLTIAACLTRARRRSQASAEESPMQWSLLLGTLLVALVPALAILKQPDLGTALVVGAVALLMLYLAGASPARLALLVLPGLAFLAQHLRGYQRERLLVFLDPERDPTGAGWNLIQARLAVGGGHFWGQGLFAGAQKQLHFVPEQHTDFIFTVAGEELGWIGCVAILLLYALVVVRGLRIAARASDPFGSLLASGIVGLLALHVVVNVGMVIGLLPVVGVPLPLLSSGGSNLCTTLVALGLLESVALHRKVVFEPGGLVPDYGLSLDPDQRQVLNVAGSPGRMHKGLP
jgi:rod shape determining protein RodA